MGPPKMIDQKLQVNKGAKYLKKSFKCIGCCRMINPEKIYEISLKSVINNYEQTRDLNIKKQMEIDFTKSIRRQQNKPDEMIYVEESDEECENEKQFPSWLDTTVQRFKVNFCQNQKYLDCECCNTTNNC